MSKIQKALHRIQVDRLSTKKDRKAPTNVPVERGASDTVVPGQMTEGLDDAGIRVVPADGGVVSIDKYALEAQGFLAPQDQARHLADQYRIIKRPLLDNASGKGGFREDGANLIMVTSALPGDGKTFNCLNLALSMALEKDTSVLLVDADVAKAHVSDLFGVSQRAGLIDLLRDESIETASVVMRTDIPGLRLLPAGSRDEHATELLASRRMEKIVNELSHTYTNRIVIFDSPPLLATSEARVLASSVGQIVMVVRAGKTPQQAVLGALESLDESKAVNLILNESDAGLTSEIYGSYGQGDGYGHGMRAT